MSKLTVLPLPETMTSTQLAEMLGYEKKEINRKIKEMFRDKIDGGKIPPSLDSRGYVTEYHLPELESKMFVAKYDINYLETITQFWIDRNKTPAPEPALQVPSSVEAQAAAIVAYLVPGVDRTLLASQTLTQMQKNSGVNTGEIARSLPARTVKRPDLNATAAGKLLGLSAVKFNRTMQDLGLQYKNERNEWELTVEGMKYAEQVPYNSESGHSGYQILWFDTITELFEV